MRRQWLLDTNVFNRPPELLARLGGELILCSVVAQELLVGLPPEKRQRLDSLFKRLSQHNDIATPSHDDWLRVGRRLRKLLGYESNASQRLSKGQVNLLVRDALIAQCAITRNSYLQKERMNSVCIIVTDNLTDFQKVTAGTNQEIRASREVLWRVK